jgi:integrase
MGTAPDGRPVRCDVRGATRAEVTQKVTELERRCSAGAVTVTGRTTLAAWLEDWIALRDSLGTVRPLTVKGCRTDQRRIVDAIGRVQLGKLNQAHIEQLWKSMVREGLSVAHCRCTLMAALNDAVGRGLLLRNPVKTAVTPRARAPRIEPYSVAQMTKLLRAAEESRNAPRWTVAIALGMRQGEVLGLCWDDVDLDAGVLRITWQLQRLGWRHGCADPRQCRKRRADCPQRWGGGLRRTEPKSDAGRRPLALPPTVIRELREH